MLQNLKWMDTWMLDDPFKNHSARVTKAAKVRTGSSLPPRYVHDTDDRARMVMVLQKELESLSSQVWYSSTLNLVSTYICDNLVIDECLLCVVVILIF